MDDVAAVAARPREPGAGVALPHTGTARPPQVVTSVQIQRDDRRAAHQGLPFRRQSRPQRVRGLKSIHIESGSDIDYN